MPGIKSWSYPERDTKGVSEATGLQMWQKSCTTGQARELQSLNFVSRKPLETGNGEARKRKQQLVLQLHLHFSINKPTKRRLNFKEWLGYIKEWKAAWNWKKMENKTRNAAGDTPTSPIQKDLCALSTSLQKHRAISIPSPVSNIFMLHGKKIL